MKGDSFDGRRKIHLYEVWKETHVRKDSCMKHTALLYRAEGDSCADVEENFCIEFWRKQLCGQRDKIVLLEYERRKLFGT